MTPEQKARAYDKLLIKAKQIYNKENDVLIIHTLEDLLPELKESEDEKTRKRVIALVNAHGQGMYKGDMLAWLENIPYTIDHEKREGFHLGYKAGLEKQGESSDKIHYWTEEEIEPIISDYLRGAEHYGGMIGRLRCLKPKSLEKQGDSPIKWNKNTEGNKPQVNHSVLMKTTHGIAEGEWKGEYWEQYKWAGIVRDSDVLSWMELSDLDKQGEQKPTETAKWSPQEESCICQLESLVKEQWRHAEKVNNAVDIKKMQDLMFFLKTLNPNKKPQRMISAEAKEAMYGKPAYAWSEKDEKEYKYVLKFVDNILNNCGNKKDYDHCKRCYDWLKSLKQRCTWKPSDEQMKALKEACDKSWEPDGLDPLYTLYEQLKKLKGKEV